MERYLFTRSGANGAQLLDATSGMFGGDALGPEGSGHEGFGPDGSSTDMFGPVTETGKAVKAAYSSLAVFNTPTNEKANPGPGSPDARGDTLAPTPGATGTGATETTFSDYLPYLALGGVGLLIVWLLVRRRKPKR